MDYFIHITDPGFPDRPWPGERRFGPYTLEAAQEQAVSDAAQGIALAVGIFSAEESEKRIHDLSEGKAEIPRSQIKAKGEELSKKLHETRISSLRADVDALRATLPPGMGIEEVAAILKQDQATIQEAMDEFPEDVPDGTA